MSPASTRVGVIAAAAILIVSVFYSWQRGAFFWGLDFAQLWAGGGSAPAVRGDLYGPEGQSISNSHLARAFELQQRSGALLNVLREREFLARQPGNEWLAAFVSTPFLFFTFSGFPADYDASWLVFRTLCMASAIAACLMLCRLAALSAAVSMVITAAVVALCEPLASDQRVGNVNRLQLLAVAVYFRLASATRPGTLAAAGALLGLAIAFKPNLALIPLLVFPFRMIKRRFREAAAEAAGMAAGFVAAVMAGSFFFGGFSAWTEWMAVAGRLSAAEVPRMLGNIAVLQAPLIGATVLVALVTLAAWKGAKKDDEHGLMLALVASTGPIIYLLSARVVWLHYATLSLPAGILLLGRAHPMICRVAAASTLILIATTPLAPFAAVRDVAVQTVTINLGMTALVALVIYRLMWPGPGSPRPLRRRRS